MYIAFFCLRLVDSAAHVGVFFLGAGGGGIGPEYPK